MSSPGRPRPRDERGEGGLRNTLVTLLSVVVVMGLAVLVPGLLPGGLTGGLSGGSSDSVAQAPPGEAGSVADTPLERTAGGGSYRFSAVQADGEEPVTYPSCGTIEVEVNLQGSPDPDTDLGIVLDGLDRISEATGLDLRYIGASDRRPEWEEGGFELSQAEIDDPEPVLVSFAGAEEVPDLAGEVAGIGGSVLVEQDGRSEYLTGQVTLDSDSLAELRDEPDGDEVAAAIALHELGHLVGLDHVDDRDELMYAVTTDQRDFGPGDREGLRRLGAGPCE